VCLAPLRLDGLKGKHSTLSADWEVSVRYQQLVRGELDGVQERDNKIHILRPSVMVHMYKSLCCKLFNVFVCRNYMFINGNGFLDLCV
jgi:hypothetical protein